MRGLSSIVDLAKELGVKPERIKIRLKNKGAPKPAFISMSKFLTPVNLYNHDDFMVWWSKVFKG